MTFLMRTPPSIGMPVRLAQMTLTALLLSTILMVSACGSDAPMQQQVNKNQAQFDSLLKHAQAIGVPQLKKRK